MKKTKECKHQLPYQKTVPIMQRVKSLKLSKAICNLQNFLTNVVFQFLPFSQRPLKRSVTVYS